MNHKKAKIYQLMVRHFGNVNGTRAQNGSIEVNGCGKFNDITERALREIQNMGFTHIWFTGVLEHASGTGYDGISADDEVILKGKAGSPYAVRDYFDVSPDLAVVVQDRLEEFSELLRRCSDLGLKSMIDFIPNHVARSYSSDVKPELSFGEGDQPSVFFHPDNNFFYLNEHHGSGPLILPDGVYEREREIGCVTGNNAATWTPSRYDWYETVKLNYGHDYTKGRDTKHLEDLNAESIPDTWVKMDAILEYWQGLGVGGFRCDMAHMVPMPFWAWLVDRARQRERSVYFMAEAYDGDPAKLCDENVLHALLDSGFDSVYDGDSYELVQEIYEHHKWANDLDTILWDEARLHKMLRYAENHDEVRVANPQRFGGHGAKVGRSVSALLFTLGQGPVMLYNGQEVGEPAIGSEGFGQDDGRSSIFDYWSLPELSKWVNGHQYDGGLLSQEQRELRDWYTTLLKKLDRPAFVSGGIYGLNFANLNNAQFGRLVGESVSGHWLYAFLRSDQASGDSVLVVINLHPTQDLENIVVVLPDDARQWLGQECSESVQIDRIPSCHYALRELNALAQES